MADRRRSQGESEYRERARSSSRSYERADDRTRSRSYEETDDRARSRSYNRANQSARESSRSSSRASSGTASRSSSRASSRTSSRSYDRGSSRYQADSRASSSRSAHSRSSQPAPQRHSGFLSQVSPTAKLIALAAIALVLVVIIAVVLVNLLKPPAPAASQSASAVNAAAVSSTSAGTSSAESASPSESAAASSASTTATETSATAVKIPIVNAKPGDVSYVVSQAAKLKHRDADFAVNPARTDWNYDKTNGHKTIYLTFDDGPSANTESVLNTLDKYGCKATFFVTGQNPDYFPWIKEAYDRGHTIGLHSYSHDYGSCYSSTEGFWNEFDEIGAVVKDQIGYVPCFIRFPGGASNTVSADYSQGIMTELAKQVHERGYQYYDWDLSCGDGSVHTADELVYYGCEPTDEENVIYLAHDGSAKQTTAEALPAIIEYYQSQGYSFEAIDRNTLVYQHGISN